MYLDPQLKEAIRAAQRSGQRLHHVRDANPEDFGIGGCDAQVCGPVGAPGKCYELVAKENDCQLKTIAGGQRAVAGQALIDFTVDLDMSNYFMPLFVRLFGMENLLPDNPAIWKMTAARIGKIPQECFDESNPVPATHLQGIFSSSWDHFQADGKQIVRSGVRVKWGCFSRQTLSKPLQIFGFAPGTAVPTIDVYAEVTGYCIDSLPSGWKCGKYPGDPPGSGGGGGSGGVPGMGSLANPHGGGRTGGGSYPVP